MVSVLDILRTGIWMVGAEGFEPSTFWSRTKRATRLRYAPVENLQGNLLPALQKTRIKLS